MPMFNVVNAEAIDAFLLEVAEGDLRLFALMRQCLTRALLREEGALRILNRRPFHAPLWLTPERFERDGPFYRFDALKVSADPRLRSAILTVKAWLQQALASKHEWIVDGDGRPRLDRVKTIGRLDHLLAIIEKDRFVHGLPPNQPAEPQGHTQIVLTLSRGWEWRRLLTPEALRQEGLMMRHCLGNGQYDVNVLLGRYQYYSLRDGWGRSRITLEVRDGIVTQRRGRGNSAPARRHLENIRALCEAKGWTGVVPFPERWDGPMDFRNDPDYTGACVIIDGDLSRDRLSGRHRMPYVLRVGGTLDLTGATDITVLPHVMSVGGDFLLEGCVNLVRMPEWLWVAGDLEMEGCRSVKVLGHQTAVRGEMCLNDCSGLQRLPFEMRVGRKLDLRGCPELMWISDRIEVHGPILLDEGLYDSIERANAVLDARMEV